MALYKDVGMWHWVGIDYYAIFKPEALFFVSCAVQFWKNVDKMGVLINIRYL